MAATLNSLSSFGQEESLGSTRSSYVLDNIGYKNVLPPGLCLAVIDNMSYGIEFHKKMVLMKKEYWKVLMDKGGGLVVKE